LKLLHLFQKSKLKHLELLIEEPIVEDKKILVAKKLLLTRRVLAKVLDNLDKEYDILEDIDNLEETLASGKYDMVFADSGLITDSIAQSNESIAIITSKNAASAASINVENGETIENSASKEDIENIIMKYRG